MLPARLATYDWSAATPDIKNERRQELWKAVVGGRPLDDLFGGVLDALDISPLAYGVSVFGLPNSWVPWRRYSEFGLVYPWRPLRAATFAADLVVPSVPLNAPAWVPSQLAWAFWHPTLIGQRPDHNDNPTTSPQEAWFLINGICTNDSLAQLNAAYLTYLFHRPITMIQNSTGGIGEDLLECALDKAMFRTGEAATKAFTPIYDALKDRNKTRVVVVAHSQGTIIAGVLLRFLQQLRAIAAEPSPRYAPPEPVYPDDIPLDPDDFDAPTDSEIAKLEVYCFANCTTRMEYLDPAAHAPWIESYGNEFDIVARLGVLAPHPEQRGVKIDGPRYVHEGAWGHFLNAHYLYDVEREQKRGRKRGPKQPNATPFVLVNANDYPGAEVPRLYWYLNGGSPSDPPWAISSVRQSDRASARSDIPPPRTASEPVGSSVSDGAVVSEPNSR
jgi:hypothetical protein